MAVLRLEDGFFSSQHKDAILIEDSFQTDRALTLNSEKYREHLSVFDLTDLQRQDLLETLFNIVVTFVDAPCGQNPEHGTGIGFPDDSMLEYTSSPSQHEARAKDGPKPGQEGA